MYVKAGATEAARNEQFLLKALEILRAEGDAVGAREVEAALARARKSHETAYPGLMAWARVGRETTESMR